MEATGVVTIPDFSAELSALIPRLRSKFIVLSANDCWPWVGRLTNKGYGVFDRNGKGLAAHRLIYNELVGEIPDGLCLDHLCRNRSCVNPAHLEPVTSAENTRRGNSGMFQKSKTHCPRGHEYSGQNTRLYAGRRICRACAALSQREFRARRKLGNGNG